MHLLNLTLGQFLAVFGSVAAVTIALYLLDRSRRRQMVATLRFWIAAEQPPVITRRRRIQQPWSLLLQLASIALLLLAVAQLRFGSRAGAPREHVLILDTSAWMSASAGGTTLMERAKQRARDYIHALPRRDRVMLVRADALATPATAFEPDRRKLEDAIGASQPGATAFDLDQALAFADRIQHQGGRRPGEIVLVSAGKVGESEPPGTARPAIRNLRTLIVADQVENCGFRKLGLRRSAADPELWEIYVSARNYGKRPRTVNLVLAFGAARGGAAAVPVGAQRVVLAPGADQGVTFQYRTRAAGLLQATLLPHDAFAQDDRAVVELPAHPELAVTVYSDEPDLLRPVLAAAARVRATFRKPSEYRPDDGAQLVILDRFRASPAPAANAIWIDPPSGGSPIPVRERAVDAPFSGWHPGNPLGAGLRTRDFKLASTSVFEAAPSDIRVGEVAQGPVVVARAGKPKIAVLGFHPARTPMRFELATPLLFANLLRWMGPEIFRLSEISCGSVGTVEVDLDGETKPSDVRVLHENGEPVPHTLRAGTLHFYAGSPGTVRVLAGDREHVYSLTLPQLWEAGWEAPADARRGIPKTDAGGEPSFDIWYWLALAGAAGLLAEFLLYGRFSRGAAPVLRMRRASSKAGAS